MKVYLVSAGSCWTEDCSIEGLFSRLDYASEYLCKHSDLKYATIMEWSLDDPNDFRLVGDLK